MLGEAAGDSTPGTSGGREPDAIESVRPEVLRGDLACGWWEPGPVARGGNADMDMFIPNN